MGNPNQWFTSNPNDMLDLIISSREEKKPAFCSVQPRSAHETVLGIEKIFWDFDYASKTFIKELDKRLENIKNEKLREIKRKQVLERRKKEMIIEVRMFAYYLKKLHFEPFLVKTRKGYHVYVFMDAIYEIDPEDFDVWHLVYDRMCRKYLNRDYKYCDSALIGNLKALSRIPRSIHESNGEICEVVDTNLNPTKLRSLEFYKSYGIRHGELAKEAKIAIEIIKQKIVNEKNKREIQKADWEINHGYTGKIRPCFTKRIEAKEMNHQQRLALEVEAFFSGYNTEEKMLDLFRNFNDFKLEISGYQINWFFKHRPPNLRPWQCDTMEGRGWCLKEECSIYRKRHNL